jgi:hypothetical protein
VNIDGGSPINVGPGNLDGFAPDDTTDLLWLRSDHGTTDHVRLRSTYDGHLLATRGEEVLASSGPGVIQRDRWQYVEVLAVLDHALGSVTVRVDEATVASVSDVDTRSPGTKPVFDTLRLTTAGFGYVTLYDDLYIRSGSTSWFLGEHPILPVTGLVFRTPTHDWRTVRNPLGPRYGRDVPLVRAPIARGVNVYLLDNGTYTERQPVQNKGVVKIYAGGHTIGLTPAERDDLVSAGYGPFISEE